MAIARVTCTCTRCGKEFEHRTKKYNRAEADAYEKWAVENITLCPTCWYAEREAEKQVKRDKALAPYTLPSLIGSEKQIVWAEKLRGQFAEDVEAFCEVNYRHPDSVQLFRAAIAELMATKADCRWWIDTRDEDFRLDGARREAIREIMAAQRAATK